MSKLIWPFIKRVAGSRIGHLLFVINLCMAIYLLVHFPFPQMEHLDCVPRSQLPISDSTFCYTLLPMWEWVFAYIVLTLPAYQVSQLFSAPINSLFPNLCYYTADRIDAALFLLCSSIQWLLIGYGLERLIKRMRT